MFFIFTIASLCRSILTMVKVSQKWRRWNCGETSMRGEGVPRETIPYPPSSSQPRTPLARHGFTTDGITVRRWSGWQGMRACRPPKRYLEVHSDARRKVVNLVENQSNGHSYHFVNDRPNTVRSGCGLRTVDARMKRAFIYPLVIAWALAVTGGTIALADENSSVNRLVVGAVKLLNQAKNEQDLRKHLELLTKAERNLNKIIDRYPGKGNKRRFWARWGTE